MDNSFVSKLRMNSIFPTGGSNPFGAPDVGGGGDMMSLFSQIYPYIAQEKERDRKHQIEMMNMKSGGHLQSIGDEMRLSPEKKPMNVVFHDNQMTPFQKAQLELNRDKMEQSGELVRGKLEQTGNLGQQKIDVSREGVRLKEEQIAINKFKAEHPGMKFDIVKGGNFVAKDPLTGKVIDSGVGTGTLSEAESIEAKGEQRMQQINRQGELRSELQDKQGTQRMEQIGKQGDNQRDVQGMRGEQQVTNIGLQNQNRKEVQEMRGSQDLAEIAARGKEQRQTNNDKGFTPSQNRTGSNNAAQELANTRPDLAQFIKFNPDSKNFEIVGNPDDVQRREIQRKLYGGPSDVYLPDDGKDATNGRIRLRTEDEYPDTRMELPPKGAKLGGKWITTPSGIKVYQEP